MLYFWTGEEKRSFNVRLIVDRSIFMSFQFRSLSGTKINRFITFLIAYTYGSTNRTYHVITQTHNTRSLMAVSNE